MKTSLPPQRGGLREGMLIYLTCKRSVWYHPGIMKDEPAKNSARKPPGWIWAAVIALWTGLIYVLFFLNLVNDFISGEGGI